MRRRQLVLVFGFALGLILGGLLGDSAFRGSMLTPCSGCAMSLYVVLPIALAIVLGRNGVELRRIGFAQAPHWRHVALALAGVASLQVAGLVLAPLFEAMPDSGRDLSRFTDVRGSLPQRLAVLALSWTFAAFGGEIAFRIVLLGGLLSLFSDTRATTIAAVVLQAAVFGFVHLYQGPAGVAGRPGARAQQHDRVADGLLRCSLMRVAGRQSNCSWS